MKKRFKWLALLMAVSFAVGGTTYNTVVNPVVVQASTGHSSGGHSSGGSHSSGGHVSSIAHTGAGGSVSSRSPASRGASTAGRVVSSRSVANRGASTAGRSVSSHSAGSRNTNTGKSTSNINSKSPATRTIKQQQREISHFSPAQRKVQSSYTKMYTGFQSKPKQGIYTPSDYLYSPYRHGFYNYYYYDAMLRQDSHVAELTGIDTDKILHPKEKTYWISVTDSKGKVAKLLVTKEQYAKINQNDNVKFIANKLFINNKAI